MASAPGQLYAAAAGCHRYASPVPEGSGAYWDGTGTAADPFHNLITLANSLTPGQTGCLVPNPTQPTLPFLGWETSCGTGLNQVIQAAEGGTTGNPITIRSADPSDPVGYRGQLWIRASNVVVSHMRFLGYPCGNKSNLIYTTKADNSSNVVLDHLDITYPRGVCVFLAGQNMTVTNSYIHHCGTDPSLVWTQGDSGAHGLYLAFGSGFTIANNVLARNKYHELRPGPAPRT